MSLSSDLISQFVKITKDDKKDPKETTLQGTAYVNNGKVTVQLDGSTLQTPVETTTEVRNGEKVKVTIKNHSATITGNISSPSARNADVEDLSEAVSAIDSRVEIAESKINISNSDIDAINSDIDVINSKISVVESGLTVANGNISVINGEIQSIGSDISAINTDISAISTNVSTANANISAINTDINNLNTRIINTNSAIGTINSTIQAQDAKINIFNTAFSVQNGVLTGIPKIITDTIEADYAKIEDLDATNATIENLDATYANIDFANIEQAAVEKIFADSGIIKDLVTDNGVITGELVGVTIRGDLIEAGTIAADRLVVRGSDGVYYKLNTDGLDSSALEALVEDIAESGLTPSDELQTKLHGSHIIAKSIVAEKIAVDDLVAFNATIGGFKIGSHSIYSGVKESVGNTTNGIYLDEDGQIAFGDVSNYVKYYKDGDDYKLAISAENLFVGEDRVDVKAVAENAMSKIQQLEDSIRTLVTDESGSTLMEQDGNSWTFNFGDFKNQFESLKETVTSFLTSGTDYIKFDLYIEKIDVFKEYKAYLDNLSETITSTHTFSPVDYGYTSAASYAITGLKSGKKCKIITNYHSEEDADTWITADAFENEGANIPIMQGGYLDRSKLTFESYEFTIPSNGKIIVKIETPVPISIDSVYLVIEPEPCIILGEDNSDLKLTITNSRILFNEGSSIPTYIKDRTLVTEKIRITDELHHTYSDVNGVAKGDYVWSVRSNGNYGLTWKEDT